MENIQFVFDSCSLFFIFPNPCEAHDPPVDVVRAPEEQSLLIIHIIVSKARPDNCEKNKR